MHTMNTALVTPTHVSHRLDSTASSTPKMVGDKDMVMACISV